MPLAIFDLDGTLTSHDSFLPFLYSFARKRKRYLSLPAFPWYCGLYFCRVLPDRVAKERLIRSVCGGQPIDVIDHHAEWFCDAWLPANLRPSAMRRLDAHQKRGDRVVLLSASPSIYVPAIARRLGISEVVCTQVTTHNGRCTGQLAGENCKGQAKVRVLQNYLGISLAPPGTVAYADQRHDLFLLRWASEGYLLNRRSEEFEPIGSASAQ